MKTSTKSPSSAAKKKILIVDDDPRLIELLGVVLAREGYEVVRADNALPALFRAVHHEPDLMMLDVNMPGMDGLDLLRQFKSHSDTKKTPVFIVTAFDDLETRTAAQKAGCAAFIPKPIDMQLLRKELGRFLPATARRTPRKAKAGRKRAKTKRT